MEGLYHYYRNEVISGELVSEHGWDASKNWVSNIFFL
jgi:hypothetical protein